MQCKCTSWSPAPSPMLKIRNLSLNPLPPDHVETITSTSNPFVKHCVRLRLSSSYRYSHASVLLVGSTPIREIYRFQESFQEDIISRKMECLFLLDKAEIPKWLDDISFHIVRVSSVVMKKLSGVESTKSIDAIALMKMPTSFFNVVDDDDSSKKAIDWKRWFPSTHRILVLEGIQDPGNLGTLLRSAKAFRWDGVFLLPGCCDPFNEKALRASRGASFQLPIVSATWTHLEALKNEFRLKMLAGHPDSNEELKRPVSLLSQGLADSLTDVPLCFLLGSEGSGISEESFRVCNLVSIPMAGKFESLNVSVAGGIFLYMLQPENQIFV